MTEHIFRFSAYDVYRKYQPTVLPQMFILSALILFKAFSRQDLGYKGAVVSLLVVVFVCAILRGIYLRIFGRGEERVILNDMGISHERPKKAPKMITWTEVERVDFREMKKHGLNSVKIYGAGKSISFDNLKGDYGKFKAAIAQRVDHSKFVWGRVSTSLWLGIFLGTNAAVLLYLLKDNSTWGFIGIFMGILNLIVGGSVFWTSRTLYRREPNL